MKNRIWLFESVVRRYDDGVASGWKWQARLSDGTVIDCAATFDTFDECVADAQCRGFPQLRGHINPADGLATAAGVYTVEVTDAE